MIVSLYSIRLPVVVEQRLANRWELWDRKEREQVEEIYVKITAIWCIHVWLHYRMRPDDCTRSVRDGRGRWWSVAHLQENGEHSGTHANLRTALATRSQRANGIKLIITYIVRSPLCGFDLASRPEVKENTCSSRSMFLVVFCFWDSGCGLRSGPPVVVVGCPAGMECDDSGSGRQVRLPRAQSRSYDLRCVCVVCVACLYPIVFFCSCSNALKNDMQQLCFVLCIFALKMKLSIWNK